MQASALRLKRARAISYRIGREICDFAPVHRASIQTTQRLDPNRYGTSENPSTRVRAWDGKPVQSNKLPCFRAMGVRERFFRAMGVREWSLREWLKRWVSANGFKRWVSANGFKRWVSAYGFFRERFFPRTVFLRERFFSANGKATNSRTSERWVSANGYANGPVLPSDGCPRMVLREWFSANGSKQQTPVLPSDGCPRTVISSDGCPRTVKSDGCPRTAFFRAMGVREWSPSDGCPRMVKAMGVREWFPRMVTSERWVSANGFREWSLLARIGLVLRLYFVMHSAASD
jgi:hypothetical protein